MKDEANWIESLWIFRFGGRLRRAVATRWRRWLRKIQIALSADRYAAKEDYINPQVAVEWWERHLNNTIFREVAAGPVPLGRVLDLGCNHGANSVLMAQQGYDVTGVDLNAAAIQVAKARLESVSAQIGGRLCFCQARLDVLPFPDGAFDGAFMIDVIEHLYPRDRGVIFKEILRVLKPGGRLLIVTPYEHAYDNCIQHVDFFDQAKLRSVLEGLGLRVLSVERDRRRDDHTPGGHDRLNALCERP